MNSAQIQAQGLLMLHVCLAARHISKDIGPKIHKICETYIGM